MNKAQMICVRPKNTRINNRLCAMHNTRLYNMTPYKTLTFRTHYQQKVIENLGFPNALTTESRIKAWSSERFDNRKSCKTLVFRMPDTGRSYQTLLFPKCQHQIRVHHALKGHYLHTEIVNDIHILKTFVSF